MLRKKHRKGQAYTEFVIVLPGMLLLILLAWEFAYFWWGRLVVSSGTFEATRQVAEGQSPAAGYQIYNQILQTGLGKLSVSKGGHFSIAVQPGLRSVRSSANVPWQWPSGLGGLMGGGLSLQLKSSAFFRLEEFYPGPPGKFE
jgi:hypothetical protein